MRERPASRPASRSILSWAVVACMAPCIGTGSGCAGSRPAAAVDGGTGPPADLPPDAGSPDAGPGELSPRRLTIAAFVPRVVERVDPSAQYVYGDFDFDMLGRLVGAGLNLVDASIENMSKDPAVRQELRRRFVAEAKRLGIRYGHTIPREGEAVEDEGFLGGGSFLDEPLVYFPNESTPPLPDAVTAASEYVEFVRSLLDIERKGGRPEDKLPVSANVPSSIAWYDLKAGAQGFWFEILSIDYLANLAFFNYGFGLDIPETAEDFVRLSVASCRGAGRNFGRPWGVGIYVGTPEAERLGILTSVYDRGGSYFYLWAFHEDGPVSPDNALELVGSLSAHARQRPVAKARAEATVALLIPAGYYIPRGFYCRQDLVGPDGKCQEEGYMDLGFWGFSLKQGDATAEVHRAVFRKIGEEVKRLLAASEEFDILVDDEALRPEVLAGYQRVIRVQ